MKSYGSPHLAAGTLLLLAATFGLCGSGQSHGTSVPSLVIPSLYGADLFQFYCASCHGQDGKGQGPLTPRLAAAPPDLTTIATRNAGTFPAKRIEAVLTGEAAEVPGAHGSRIMPRWGPIFRALDPADARARVRISNIVAHLASVQEPGLSAAGWTTYPIAEAAYFPEPDATLEAAQIAKMDLVCRKLYLRPGERVVEAGCGWGSLALFMARHYGVQVRAFNVSPEQVAYARHRPEKRDLRGLWSLSRATIATSPGPAMRSCRSACSSTSAPGTIRRSAG